jgi:hypothetical protein
MAGVCASGVPVPGQHARRKESSMTGATALTDLSLREASALLHRRALSPVELTEAYLARIERWNPHLNRHYRV